MLISPNNQQSGSRVVLHNSASVGDLNMQHINTSIYANYLVNNI